MPVHDNTLKLRQQLKLVFWVFMLITAVEVINLLSGRFLNQFALVPREIDTLIAILLVPLLHGSLWHYGANIVPLCIFVLLLLQYGQRRALLVSLWVIAAGGLLVWLFGRQAYHLGASGLLYGLFGYLLLGGILSARLKLLAISLLVGFFYGGLVFGVLPSKPYISWESHLFGFIAGLAAAWFWRQRRAT